MHRLMGQLLAGNRLLDAVTAEPIRGRQQHGRASESSAAHSLEAALAEAEAEPLGHDGRREATHVVRCGTVDKPSRRPCIHHNVLRRIDDQPSHQAGIRGPRRRIAPS